MTSTFLRDECHRLWNDFRGARRKSNLSGSLISSTMVISYGCGPFGSGSRGENIQNAVKRLHYHTDALSEIVDAYGDIILREREAEMSMDQESARDYIMNSVAASVSSTICPMRRWFGWNFCAKALLSRWSSLLAAIDFCFARSCKKVPRCPDRART